MTISPAGQKVPVTVTLSTATADATIRYTTDGSTPTASSTSYTGPLTVETPSTLTAQAFLSGWEDSPVSAETYTWNPTVITPDSSAVPVAVAITNATPNAVIYYTTDGSTPTTSSTRYDGPLKLTSAQTCLLYTSPSPRDGTKSRMPSSA